VVQEVCEGDKVFFACSALTLKLRSGECLSCENTLKSVAPAMMSHYLIVRGTGNNSSTNMNVAPPHNNHFPNPSELKQQQRNK
jgi:hypothetical protein